MSASHKKFAVRFFMGILALALWHGKPLAQEHPEEHPTKKTAVQKKKMPTIADFAKAAEKHIKGVQKKNKGFFPIKDDKEGRTRSLKFKKVHKERLTHLEGDTYFACTDFVEMVNGKKVLLDLDFWMDFKNGKWTMKKSLIHKVNGEKRIEYKNNQPVPVQ